MPRRAGRAFCGVHGSSSQAISRIGGKMSRLTLVRATRFRARVLKRLLWPSGRLVWDLLPASHELRSRDVEKASRNASDVESQESCIHPMLSHAARAPCPALLSIAFPTESTEGKWRQRWIQIWLRIARYKLGRFHAVSYEQHTTLPRRSPARAAKGPVWGHGSCPASCNGQIMK
jgi:hypothetical protein